MQCPSACIPVPYSEYSAEVTPRSDRRVSNCSRVTSGFGTRIFAMSAFYTMPGRHDGLVAAFAYQRWRRTSPGPPPAAAMEVSVELLGQSDDDALRATQEAEPVA